MLRFPVGRGWGSLHRSNGAPRPGLPAGVPLDLSLELKKASVVASIRARRGLVVALSGGVDSAVLLALAARALGPSRVLAVTGVSESLAAPELEDAARIANALGVRHETVATRELDRPAYAANLGDRCYHCRSELFEVLDAIARREGFGAIAYGAIADDLGDDRPGMRAASERGILAPLLDAGFSKRDVRTLAAELGLDVVDKPASPCLSSRIPAGSPVTVEKLAQIDRAESSLKALGLRTFRVRHHGEIARVEADDEGSALLADPAVRAEAVRRVKGAGFRFVTLDLEGFRSGKARRRAGPLYSIGPARDRGQ